MNIIRSILLFALLGAPVAAHADSPLTSTPFHTEYSDVPAVVRARDAQVLDDATMAALRDPAVANDVRAAIVNALGWRYYDGREPARRHARTFLDYVAGAHGVPAHRLRIDDLTNEELFALGYLAAMDRYRHLDAIGGTGGVERATPQTLLQHAARRAPGDRTITTVHALVLAQAQMERDDISNGAAVQRGFCNVWRRYTATVGAPAQRDLRPPAREIVERYMSGYSSSCR